MNIASLSPLYRPTRNLRAQAGFSMIEILVTLAIISLALLGTAGCSSLKFWGKDKGDEIIEGSPEQLYSEAIRDIKNNNYPNAIARYEMLEARYPFSEQAKQGQLDLMFAFGIQSTGRLIQQQDFRIVENGPGQSDALALAT